MIRVTLAGATGWVGKPLAAAIEEEDDLELVAAVSRTGAGHHRTAAAALQTPSDVFVDYTSAAAVRDHVLTAIEAGRHVVIGSSGLTNDDFDSIEKLAHEKGVGVIAVGNFAITAALLQKFAVEAAKYLPHWEMIDSAYLGKMDAPSGTARELAWRLSAAEDDPRIHSVRLPGYTIGLEIRFGRTDERLTIQYDGGPGATPYIAGTLLAIRRAPEIRGLVRGLDRIL